MKKYFQNATSLERRFLIVTALLLFIVLNLLFIRPLFSDWARYQARRQKAGDTLTKFEEAIARSEKLKPLVTKLEGEGMAVPAEDQTVNFMTAIQSQASLSGISILTSSAQPERTNQFFLERARSLTLQAREDQLVDFLYNLGAGNSLIRVRGLSLGTDTPRQNIRANVTLVASYQKKVAARPAPAPAATDKPKPAPAAAPAADQPKSAPAKSDPTAVPPASGVPKPLTPTKK